MNIETLKDQGWVEFPPVTTSAARNFAKQFGTQYRCRCNDKPKIQIVLKYHVFELSGAHESYELSLTGEALDGEWVDLRVFGLNNLDKLYAHCEKLLTAWEAVNMYCERRRDSK